MPIFNVCGTNYPYPNVGDKPWGTIHIAWAAAVSACVTSVQTQVTILQTTALFNPMIADGDMIAQIAGVPDRVPVGTDGDVLTLVAGLPTWVGAGGGVPVAAILPWYDFNTLTIPSGYVYCDGLVINAPGSLIDGETTPDLSGAYICGFGTLGAGDIGTAPFTATPIGNVDHEVALAHTHTIAGTAIDGLLSTAAGLGGTIRTEQVSDSASGFGAVVDPKVIVDNSGNTVTTLRFQTAAGTNNGEGQHRHDMPSLSHTHNITGAGSANTGSSLATTNIQPRTQQVRFIMKT